MLYLTLDRAALALRSLNEYLELVSLGSAAVGLHRTDRRVLREIRQGIRRAPHPGAHGVIT